MRGSRCGAKLGGGVVPRRFSSTMSHNPFLASPAPPDAASATTRRAPLAGRWPRPGRRQRIGVRAAAAAPALAPAPAPAAVVVLEGRVATPAIAGAPAAAAAPPPPPPPPPPSTPGLGRALAEGHHHAPLGGAGEPRVRPRGPGRRWHHGGGPRAAAATEHDRHRQHRRRRAGL